MPGVAIYVTCDTDLGGAFATLGIADWLATLEFGRPTRFVV
jgi:hypothetical protein